MADSDAHTGFGALLLKGDGASPENFVAVMGVKSMTGPSISRDTHDTTDMQSPSGWREFIGGLVDGGEVSFEANLLPRNETQNQEAGGWMAEFDKTSCDSRGNWRIVFPECEGEAEGYLEFEGIVTGQSMQFPMDDLMTFSGTIKVSGRPELVIASA
jgi:predicted secreted protein